MKNTLVCLWGLTKFDLTDTVIGLKNIFGDNIDFLISTWDDQLFNEEYFKFILKSKSPTKEYLDEIGFPFTQQIKNVPEWHSVRFGHYAQFYHNFKILQFLNDNSLNYDILVKSRTDVVFETDFNFDFSIDKCYIPEIYWASKGVGINDHFICGDFSYLKESLHIENFEEFFEIVENTWNPETILQKLLLSNNSNIMEFKCSSYLLLPDRKLL